MNTMTHALRNAGVKTPSQMQRIWQWTHDNPGTHGRTSREISTALNLPLSNVSSIITDMLRRKMCTYEVELDRDNRPTRRYRAVGNSYELLQPPVATPAPITTPPAPEPKGTMNIDHLTIGEARALYNQLKEIFG